MALLDETGAVLQKHLINPNGDYLAYIDAQTAGITAQDLAQAEQAAAVATALADYLTTLASTAPVRLVMDDADRAATALADALTQRCGGPPHKFGAGIDIITADKDTANGPNAAIPTTQWLHAKPPT